MPTVAAMARPGEEALLAWSLIARDAPYACYAAYMEDTRGWRIEAAEERPQGLRPPVAARLFALIAAPPRGVCGATSLFARSGHMARVYIAAPGPVSREAVLTANPPAPSRRLPSAVAVRLAHRLVELEGVGYMRLAARLAKLLGGEAALLVLVERRGPPAPLVYYASTKNFATRGSPGRWVAAGVRLGTQPRLPGVLHLRPQAGIIRAEYVSLDRALRS